MERIGISEKSRVEKRGLTRPGMACFIPTRRQAARTYRRTLVSNAKCFVFKDPDPVLQPMLEFLLDGDTKSIEVSTKLRLMRECRDSIRKLGT